ncbi:hypothetical protein BDZ91DRAFT_182647 [Kalaharituber pfeilii]|nr:hypothetical protein BDZ91DRAFT_182647 [Kalaharituber pfeilii]
MAKERDNGTCIVSGSTLAVQIAHIFPYSAGNLPGFENKPNLVKLLELFAGPQVLARLKDYLGPTGSEPTRTHINRLENLICLGMLEHHYWRRGLFVLEPVGDPLAALPTPTSPLVEYSVRVSWLTRNSADQKLDMTQVMDIGQPLALANDPELNQPYIRNYRTSIGKDTGAIIVLRTPDAIKYPLPHPDLLMLHAALSRLVRCAGAAPVEDDFATEDSEDDGEFMANGEGATHAEAAQQVSEVDVSEASFALQRFLREP